MILGSFQLLENCCWFTSKQIERKPELVSHSNRPTKYLCGRRLVTSLPLCYLLSPLPIKAEEKKQENDVDTGVIGAIKSYFDPNEKTKSGKTLPKAYIKAAREVVKTLRESLEEDAKDVAKFRRTADAAKESIREYLNGWKGQNSVSSEESYVAVEKAIRALANFYSKAGPFATLPEDVKSSILNDLKTADDNL
ncbi:putative photosystem II Pbs27 [Dioscorea sansibarensis]